MGTQTETMIRFPEWAPPLARMDLQKRYSAGEFFGRQWRRGPTGEFLGEHLVYPGLKPWGAFHAWVGRTEFLNRRTGRPDLELEFFREVPEDLRWWAEWTASRPTLTGIADKMCHWAIAYNRLMGQYLKDGISIADADTRAQKKFKEDFILMAGVATLHHLFAD